MTLQTVTIQIPQSTYAILKERSKVRQHSITDEVTSLIISSAKAPRQSRYKADFAQLELMSDQELWKAARTMADPMRQAEAHELLEKLKLVGLTDVEEEQMKLFSEMFGRIMLIRSKAAAILYQRGHDIDDLIGRTS